MRYVLRQALPNPGLFASLLKIGRAARPLLPGGLKDSIPAALVKESRSLRAARYERKMLVLQGCVQPGLAPNINAAAMRVLDKLGISLISAPDAGCCGAVSYHLNAQQEGLDYMRRNVDAWWPYVAPEPEKGPGAKPGTKERATGGTNEETRGIEAIVMTASGCGVTVKEYGHLLRHDPAYAEKAARISELTRDISEIVEAEMPALVSLLNKSAAGMENPKQKLAFHSPCTLQHGMRIRGVAEKILTAVGFDLTYVPDAHLCCGSAGTYSILQPELSQQLLKNKVTALESGHPDRIATANIGCLTHIRSGAALPVEHWIEILDETLEAAQPGTIED
jgi:glycolate oxidase iron-sulfur subunit